MLFTSALPHPIPLQLSTSNNLALELDTGSAYSWSISMATPSDLKPTGLSMLPIAASSPFPTSASSPLPTSGSDHSRVCGGPVPTSSYQKMTEGLSERVSRREKTRRIHKLEQSKVIISVSGSFLFTFNHFDLPKIGLRYMMS